MIEDGLRSLLAGTPSIRSIVDDRVRVAKLRQSDSFPAVVIDVPSMTHHNDLSGHGGLVEATATVMCMAHTIQQARELSEAVRLRLAGYTGAAGSDTIDACYVNETTSGFVPLDDFSDAGIFSVDCNCTVWHQEPV